MASNRCPMCKKFFMAASQLAHHQTNAERLCKPAGEGEKEGK